MEDGIYYDIPIEAYHADKSSVSSTGMKHAKRSLREYWLYLQGFYDTVEKPIFDFGNAFELALLDPKMFNEKVAVEKDIMDEIYAEKPDTESPRSTGLYQKWLKEQHRLKKYVVHSEGENSYQCIEKMLQSCHMDAVIQRLIKNINYQVSLYWTDPDTGLKMKARPDFVKTIKSGRKSNVIVDLKTAIDGSPEAFNKVIGNNELWMQAAIQIEGALASGLMDSVDSYYWLVVEKKPPFNATIYHFTPDDIKWARDMLAYYKKLVFDAQRLNAFPGYTQRADNKHGILTAEIPLWVRK